MKYSFYGIERARGEGWMLIEYPPPGSTARSDRMRYEERLQRLRWAGAVIVGFRRSENPRTESVRCWTFGLPSKPVSLDFLRDLAQKAGMLEDPTSEAFTFRWYSPILPQQQPRAILLHCAEVLWDRLTQISKTVAIPKPLRAQARSAALYYESRRNLFEGDGNLCGGNLSIWQEVLNGPTMEERRRGGRQGGLAYAQRTSPRKRSQLARAAAMARWSKSV